MYYYFFILNKYYKYIYVLEKNGVYYNNSDFWIFDLPLDNLKLKI